MNSFVIFLYLITYDNTFESGEMSLLVVKSDSSAETTELSKEASSFVHAEQSAKKQIKRILVLNKDFMITY